LLPRPMVCVVSVLLRVDFLSICAEAVIVVKRMVKMISADLMFVNFLFNRYFFEA